MSEYMFSEAHAELCQASKVEWFMKTVNGF